MQKFKRKILNFSIKRSFQFKLLIRILFIILLGTAVTSGVFYFYANREISDSFRQFHITARNFLDYLLPAVLVSSGAGLTIAIIISLFFPGSLAGPLYRIERDLREKVGEGDLTLRYRLRKGDELKDLAETLNIVLDKIGLRVKDIESASVELSQLISENDNRNIKGLKEVGKRLTQAVKKFKIQQ